MTRPRLWWLGLAVALASGPALADDVTLTTSYPSPYGQYDNLTVQDGVVTGTDTTAASTAKFYGAVNVQGANAVNVEAPTAVGGYGGLVVDNGTLRVDTDCSYYTCGMYWVSLGKLPRQAIAELDINGPLSASQLMVADALAAQLLSLQTQTDGAKTWGQVRGQDPTGWGGLNSRVRIPAQPKVVLNLNSGAPVGIGTEPDLSMPTRKLQVGSLAFPLSAMATFQGGPSFRVFKKDIAPLAAADYREVLAQLGVLEVVRYRYKNDPVDRRLRLGFIAEDAPHDIVTERRDGIVLDKLVGYLLAAVKALGSENERLEHRVEALEGRVGGKTP